MKKILRRYRNFLLTLVVLATITYFNRNLGQKALSVAGYSFKEMIVVIPPIFLLLGLLDVWVPRETMVKFMGEHSGLKGAVLSFILGSAAAGPLYGAFPIAAVFMKKGVGFQNIMIFIGAWSTTKIPMFLFELTSLGAEFAITRLIIDIPGILLIAGIVSALISPDEKAKIYEKAQKA